MKYVNVIWLFFLNRTPIFDWCAVRQESKNKQNKDTCSKRLDLFFITFINYSTLDNERNWEDLCFQLRNQQTCASDNHK